MTPDIAVMKNIKGDDQTIDSHCERTATINGFHVPSDNEFEYNCHDNRYLFINSYNIYAIYDHTNQTEYNNANGFLETNNNENRSSVKRKRKRPI